MSTANMQLLRNINDLYVIFLVVVIPESEIKYHSIIAVS